MLKINSLILALKYYALILISFIFLDKNINSYD